MDYRPINFQEKLGKFSDLWSPRVIAELNHYQFKLARIEGEFVWHAHNQLCPGLRLGSEFYGDSSMG